MRHWILTFLLFSSCLPLLAQMPRNWMFRDELLNGLEHPGDTTYICDRKKLIRAKESTAKDTLFRVSAKVSATDWISVTLKTEKFIAKGHTLKKDSIDGQQVLGVEGTVPRTHFSTMSLMWNFKSITIPPSAYRDLYSIGFAYPYSSPEVYYDAARQLIYVYVIGGDGATSYAVKFIFSQTQYITRIVSRNECTKPYDFLDATVKKCE